jgi:hypothetical protein
VQFQEKFLDKHPEHSHQAECASLLNFIGEIGDDAEDRSSKNQPRLFVQRATAAILFFFPDNLCSRVLIVCVWMNVLPSDLVCRGGGRERR